MGSCHHVEFDIYIYFFVCPLLSSGVAQLPQLNKVRCLGVVFELLSVGTGREGRGGERGAIIRVSYNIA